MRKINRLFACIAIVMILAIATRGYAQSTDPFAKQQGQCTQYASSQRPDLWECFNQYRIDHPTVSRDAYKWADIAAGCGISVNTAPQVGDVIVWGKGVNGVDPNYGHVGIVQQVLEGGKKVVVTDSNWDRKGNVTTHTVNVVSGNTFIHEQGSSASNATTINVPDPRVAYTFATTEVQPKLGSPVWITVSAADIAGNRQVTSIVLKVNGIQDGRIDGSSGTFSWFTDILPAGMYNLQLTAILTNWNGSVNAKEFTYNLLKPFAESNPSSSQCKIDSFTLTPISTATIGDIVSITAKGNCSGISVRAIRIKVDNNVVYEQGSPEVSYSWNTSGLNAGTHTIVAEVAAVGENGWANSGTSSTDFTLLHSQVDSYSPSQSTNCSITSFSINPSSPQNIGSTINISASGECNGSNNIRAMRILIDGESLYEIGAPSIAYSWNTNGYGSGSHSIVAQVAAREDNSWSSAGSSTSSFELQSQSVPPSDTPLPLPPPCQGPSLSSPSNGDLLSSNSVSLSWGSVGGASEYKAEIWGGDFGGTHQAPCGWSSGTSCSVTDLGKYNFMWRVIARVSGQECASGEWNFTIP